MMAETEADKPVILDSSMEEMSKHTAVNNTSIDDFDADDEEMPSDDDITSGDIASDDDSMSDDGDVDSSESDESQLGDPAPKLSKLDAILHKKLDYETYKEQVPHKDLIQEHVSDVVPRKIPVRQATHSISSSSEDEEEEEEEEEALEMILEDDRPPSDEEVIDMIDEPDEEDSDDDDDDFPSDFDDMSDDGEVVELLEDDSESEILKKLTGKKKDKAKQLPIDTDSSVTVHEISSNVLESSDDSKKSQVISSVSADASSVNAVEEPFVDEPPSEINPNPEQMDETETKAGMTENQDSTEPSKSLKSSESEVEKKSKKDKSDKPKKKHKKKMDKNGECSNRDSEVDGKKKKLKKKKQKKESSEEGGEKKQKKQKRPRKRKKKSEADSGDTEGGEKKKKKRKRADTAEEDPDDDDDDPDKKKTKSHMRKEIRKIRDDDMLEQVTIDAQKEEQERRQRMMEKIRMQQEKQAEEERLLMEKLEAIKNSQLKSLLEDSGSDLDDELLPMEAKHRASRPDPSEVVTISSSEDDVVMVGSDAERDVAEPDDDDDDVDDPNNSGSHVNDELNIPDVNGRVLANVGHSPEDKDIFLAPQLASIIKPHQIGGVRFLYDNLVESIECFKESQGFGCILAHSMGLGKTLQVISFTEVFLRCTCAKKVLIIVPVNTLQNWVHEFDIWLPVDPAEVPSKPDTPPPKKKPERRPKKKREPKPKKEVKAKEDNSQKKEGKDGEKGDKLNTKDGVCAGGMMEDGRPRPPYPGPPHPGFMPMPGYPPYPPINQPGDFKNYNGGKMDMNGPADLKFGNVPPPPHLFGNGGFGGPMPAYSNTYQSPMPPMPGYMGGQNPGYPNYMAGPHHPPPWGMMNMPPRPDMGCGYPNFGSMAQPMDMPPPPGSFRDEFKNFMNFNPMDMPPMPPMPPMPHMHRQDARTDEVSGQATDLSATVTKDFSLPEVKDLSLPEPKDLSVKNIPNSEELEVPNNDCSNTQSQSKNDSRTDGKNAQDSISTDATDGESKTQSESQQMDTSILKSEHPMFPDFSDLQREADIRPEFCSMDDVKPKELMDSSLTVSTVKTEASQSDVNTENPLSSDIKDSIDCKQEMPDIKIKLDSPKSETNDTDQKDHVGDLDVAHSSVSGDCGKVTDSKGDVAKSQTKIAGSDDESESKGQSVSQPTNCSAPQETDDDSTAKTGFNSKDESGKAPSAKDGDESKEEGEGKEESSFLDQIDEIFKEKEPEVTYRQFKLHCVNDNLKTTVARAKIVDTWHKEGGVLLMGYEMYRLLTSRRVLAYRPKTRKKRSDAKEKDKKEKKDGEPEVIDLDEEDRNKELMANLQDALVKPGPDLIVCDEGHRIKNSHANISQALKNIRTKRRIVLTGYPLQNNLLEYWCMVDFVRPNYLGNKTEFCNMFERPIMNGQCMDSTPGDVKLMRYRAHVLHSLLEGFVQRRGHSVLKKALPPKEEYVLQVKMSDVQRQLYKEFMHIISDSGLVAWANNNPLKAFAVCCKIWNHPDILHKVVEEHKSADLDADFDIEDKASLTEGAKRITKPKIHNQDKDSSLKPLLDDMTKSNLDADGVPLKATMNSMASLVSKDSVVSKDSMDWDDSSMMPSESRSVPDSLGDMSKDSFNTGKCGESHSSSTDGNDKPKYTPWFLSDDKDETSKNNDGSDVESSQKDDSKVGDEGSKVGVDLSKPKESDSMLRDRSAKPGESDSKLGEENDPFPLSDKKEQVITYDWAYSLMSKYERGIAENSGKFVLLLSIIEEAIAVGDKILVFSQSLFTLNLIEEYLSKLNVPTKEYEEKWCKNKNYFRLDGSTSSFEREKLINQFNAEENSKIHLFLLSTRAGCLGINVVGANRVIVFDASWNPCHDCQAVCRVYRYGQVKQCVVYRFISDNTMEKKIYDRQINKQGMSDRVVDELNPQNNYTKQHVESLLQYEDKDLETIDPNCVPEEYTDQVIRNVVQKHHKWITVKPFTHESLLIDRKEEKLTKNEKRLAKQGYEMEKKMNISYSRPSYAAFYPKNGPGLSNMVRPSSRYSVSVNRPVASVRPMMSTPIPMRAGAHIGRIGQSQPQGILRPGVSVQQIQTTTDIIIPGTATNTDSRGSRIPAGENVLVIKTPKGVYIRTNQGKIFAVRTAPKCAETNTSGRATSVPNPRQVVTVCGPGSQGQRIVVSAKPGAATTTVGATGVMSSILPMKAGSGAGTGAKVTTVTLPMSKDGIGIKGRPSVVTTSLLHMASGTVATNKPTIMKGNIRPNNYKIIKVKVGNQPDKDGSLLLKMPPTSTTIQTVMPIMKTRPAITVVSSKKTDDIRKDNPSKITVLSSLPQKIFEKGKIELKGRALAGSRGDRKTFIVHRNPDQSPRTTVKSVESTTAAGVVQSNSENKTIPKDNSESCNKSVNSITDNSSTEGKLVEQSGVSHSKSLDSSSDKTVTDSSLLKNDSSLQHVDSSPHCNSSDDASSASSVMDNTDSSVIPSGGQPSEHSVTPSQSMDKPQHDKTTEPHSGTQNEQSMHGLSATSFPSRQDLSQAMSHKDESCQEKTDSVPTDNVQTGLMSPSISHLSRSPQGPQQQQIQQQSQNMSHPTGSHNPQDMHQQAKQGLQNQTSSITQQDMPSYIAHNNPIQQEMSQQLQQNAHNMPYQTIPQGMQTGIQPGNQDMQQNSQGIQQNGQGMQQSSQGMQQNSQGMQQNSQDMQQNSQGIQQNGQGMQQNGQGMQQSSQGMQQKSQGMQQNSQGMQQNSQGMQQSSQGMQQNSQGMQQSSHGMQQSSQGMQQNSQGMQQSSQGMQENSQVMQQNSQGMQPNSQGMPSGNQGMHPNSHGMQPGNQGMQPGQSMQPGSQGMQPNSQGMQSGNQGMQPSSQGMQPNSQGMQPNSQGMQRGSQGMQPGNQGMQPGNQGMQPNSQGMQPGQTLQSNTQGMMLGPEHTSNNNQNMQQGMQPSIPSHGLPYDHSEQTSVSRMQSNSYPQPGMQQKFSAGVHEMSSSLGDQFGGQNDRHRIDSFHQGIMQHSTLNSPPGRSPNMSDSIGPGEGMTHGYNQQQVPGSFNPGFPQNMPPGLDATLNQQNAPYHQSPVHAGQAVQMDMDEANKSGKSKKPRKPREPKTPKEKLPKPPKEKKVPKEKKPKTTKTKKETKKAEVAPFRTGFNPQEEAQMQAGGGMPGVHPPHIMPNENQQYQNMTMSGGFQNEKTGGGQLHCDKIGRDTSAGDRSPDALGLLGESLLESIGVLNQGDEGSTQEGGPPTKGFVNPSGNRGEHMNMGSSQDKSIPQSHPESSLPGTQSPYGGQSNYQPYPYSPASNMPWSPSSNTTGWTGASQHGEPAKSTSSTGPLSHTSANNYNSNATSQNTPRASTIDNASSSAFTPMNPSIGNFSAPSPNYNVGFPQYPQPHYPYPPSGYYPPPSTPHYPPTASENWSSNLHDTPSSYSPYTNTSVPYPSMMPPSPHMPFMPQPMVPSVHQGMMSPPYGYHNSYLPSPYGQSGGPKGHDGHNPTPNNLTSL